jgi:phytoene/squalene synthetase
MDVTKLRYSDWDDLIGYCTFSAMPVGRFVLDVHGESRATWPANDALCAALQINNHLQDAANDFRDLNRVYIPLDAFAAAGAAPEQLGAARASPELQRCIRDLAARNERLLVEGEPFPGQIENTRLALEVAVIHSYARRIVALLQARDPLSERVHLSKAQFALYGFGAVITGLMRRIGRPRPVRKPQDAQHKA